MLNNILLSVKPKPAALQVPLALLSLALNGLTTSPSRIEPTAAGLAMAFAQSAGAARQATPTTLKSPEAYSRVWRSVVTLVGGKAELGRLGRIDASPIDAAPDLREAAAPIPPEYSGQPALDQAGRVIGVAMDPGIKGAPANG